MYFKKEEKMVFSMPGVPYEMKALFTEQVLPIINENNNGGPVIANKTVLVYNIPESMLAEMIEEWENALPDNMSLAYLPSPGLVKLRITAKGEDKESLMSDIDDKFSFLSEYVSIDKSELSSLKVEERLHRLALEKKVSISTAESCTGGFIAHLITSISGSSLFFKGSVIAYSNEVKENLLKVHSADIDAHGAVSQLVVEQMAKGVREQLSTDYSVATSGIAGPDGGSAEEPVGTVWIAVSSARRTISKCYYFSKNRERNIHMATNMALNMLCKELAEK
jgi:nicotinamide-nucleotide amidase